MYREGLGRIARFARAGRDPARGAAVDLAAFGDLLVHVSDLADGRTHLRSVVRKYRRRHDPRTPGRHAVAPDAGLWPRGCDRHHAWAGHGLLPRALQSVR